MRRKYFKTLKEAKEVVNNDPHYLGLRSIRMDIVKGGILYVQRSNT
jgi:hypothetical protein